MIERVRTLIGGRAKCLLLGSTMEYAAIGPDVIAMDVTFPMLAGLWVNGTPSRLGIQSDWTCMPVSPRAFTHVLGDGSLNAVPTSALPAVLDEVVRVLQPQGSLVARVFCRPETAETVQEIQRDVLAGRAGTFHALKWRVAMSSLPDPASSDIAVREIRRAVNACFPDRETLSSITGWSRAEIDTIDVYEHSTGVYNFPTEAQVVLLLRRWFEDVEIVRCGTYPLAERCPLVVARAPRSATC